MDILLKYKHRFQNFEVFVTEFVCVCYLAIAIAILFFSIFGLLLGNLTLADYGWIGANILLFLVLCPITVAVVMSLGVLVRLLYKIFCVKNKKRADALVALGTIAVIGMLPTILQFFEKSSVYMWVQMLLLYNVTCLSVVFVFFMNLTPSAYSSIHDIKTGFSALGFHILLFSMAGYIASCYYQEDTDGSPGMGLLTFGSICLPSATEFFIVLGGKLEGQSDGAANRANENTAVVAPKKEHDSRIECEVCLLEYSDCRFPRMLKECGHTICEKCADKLLNKNNEKFLLCPFCQTMTITNGPVATLSRNYAVYDVVRNLKSIE